MITRLQPLLYGQTAIDGIVWGLVSRPSLGVEQVRMLHRKRGFNLLEPLMVVAIRISRCLSRPVVPQRTRETEVQWSTS